MLNIGHRGAMGHAPENTLESIQKALDFGADWIELDVYLVDDELIVIHDPVLERTTNGQGAIADHDLAYLRSLDAGNGQQIPLLSEVFDLVDRTAGINVELKGPGTAVATVRFLENRLKSGWEREQLLLSAFDHSQLYKAKEVNPIFWRAPLYYSYLPDFTAVVNELEAYGVNPWLGDVTAELVNDAHAHDLKVMVYTVNKEDDLQRMIDLGVDGIFTNFPDRLNQLLGR